MAKRIQKKQQLDINELNKQIYEIEKSFYSLSFDVPFLPPTTNKAYFNTKFGRSKKTIATTFQNKVKQYIIENYSNKLNQINPYGLYNLELTFKFHWPKLFNIKYPKTKSPYKKKDTDNYIKLIKDIFIETIGIQDDSQIFEENPAKVGVDSEEKEGTSIFIKPKSIHSLIFTDIETTKKIIKNYIDFYKLGIRET